MIKVSIFLLFLHIACFADVKGADGSIRFDADSNAPAEMILNSTGLGIGISPSTNLQVQGNAIISGQLAIGSSSSTANLELSGTLGFGFQSVSSNTTLSDASVVLVDTSADNVILTLPYSANVLGRQYMIKKTHPDNTCYIVAPADDKFDSDSGVSFPPNFLGSVSLISSQANVWSILDINSNASAWTPAQLTTATWFDAADNSTVTLDGSGNVSQWNDKSGNDNHLKQSTADARPVYSNGLSLDFDGVDDVILRTHSTDTISNAFSASGNATIALVINTLDFTDGISTFPNLIQCETTAAGTLNRKPYLSFSRTSDLFYFTVSQGVFLTAQATTASSYNTRTALIGSQGSGYSDLYIHGSFIDAADATVYDAETTPSKISITSVNSKPYSIYEMVLIADGISEANRQKLEGYLAHKWGLVSRLPQTHPYKLHPPFVD